MARHGSSMNATTTGRPSDELTRVQHAARACAPLIHLAFDIASDSAVSEIESTCLGFCVDGKDWYETDPTRWGRANEQAPQELQMLARAVDFCDRMKLLERHPAQPTLVRFPHVQG